MERENGFMDEGETGEDIGHATTPLSAEVTGYAIPAMTLPKALEYADEWIKGVTLYEGAEGWRIVCATLASAVRRLQNEDFELTHLFKLQQVRMAQATKIWQAETGNKDTLPDLGELLGWLMEKAGIIKA